MPDCCPPRDSLEKFIIEPLLIFLLFFSPLIYGGLTILPLSIIEGLSFLVFFIYLGKALLKKEARFVKIPIFALLSFLLLVLLQLFSLPNSFIWLISPSAASLYKNFSYIGQGALTLSICPEETLNMLLQFFSYIAVFFVVLNYADTPKKIRRLVIALIACGFIYSFYGVLNRELSRLPGGFSTFTSRDHFPAYVGMAVFICIGYFLTDMHKIMRFVFIFMGSVMALAIFLTASRAGKVCFLASFAVFIILLRAKKVSFKKALPFLIILLALLVAFALFIGLAPFMERMDTLASPLKAYSLRGEIVRDSLGILRDFPLLGTGLGTFSQIAQKYKTSGEQVSYGYSHNEPVQLLAEAGILGFIFLVIFFLGFIKSVVSMWLKRHSHFAVYLTMGCLTGIFFFGLHSLFDFIFHVPANAFLFFFILGLSLRIAYSKEQQELLPVPEVRVALPVAFRVAALIILCGIFVYGESFVFKRYQAGGISKNVSAVKITQTGIDAALEYKRLLKQIDKGTHLNPLDSSFLIKRGDILSEAALRDDLKDELQAIGDFASVAEVFASAEQAYKSAINLNPAKAEYHLKLGWLYGLSDRGDLARRELDKAKALNPKSKSIASYVEKYIKSKK